MLHSISNGSLSVSADTMGAQLQSIKSCEGTEYLWQGDPKYWKGHAPNLFPYIARLTDKTCTYRGKEYHMEIHGLAPKTDMKLEEKTETSMTFRFDSDDATRERYPFDFIYRIRYSVEGKTLKIENRVLNTGAERMYFAVGGHPGINVPMEEGLKFEDYYIEFGSKCHPSHVLFSDTIFVNDEELAYPLADDQKLPLRHDLFSLDAVVLRNTAKTITIKSDKGKKAVKVSFPDFANVGFWHMPRTDAPYVCVEPWSSLPSRQGIVEDLEQQSDLIRLDAGREYVNRWSVEVIE